MEPLTVFATLALLEIPSPSALVRGVQVIRHQHLAEAISSTDQHLAEATSSTDQHSAEATSSTD